MDNDFLGRIYQHEEHYRGHGSIETETKMMNAFYKFLFNFFLLIGAVVMVAFVYGLILLACGLMCL